MSKTVSLAAIDLPLLRAVDMIYRERSVRLAADRLNVTPSAVSHMLARMRDLVADELFVRQAEGMAPTRRMRELAPHIDEALRILEAGFNALPFDPATDRSTFTIAALPYISTFVLPSIVDALLREAPNIRLRMKPLNSLLHSDLVSRHLDIAIGAFGRLPELVERHAFFRDRFVLAVRRGHPALPRLGAPVGAPVGIAALFDCAHVDIRIEQTRGEALDAYHVDGGFEQKVMLGQEEFWARYLPGKPVMSCLAPDTATALNIVARSDLVCIVTESAARLSCMDDRLQFLEMAEAPPPLDIAIIRHAAAGPDDAVEWLIERLRALRR